MVRMAMSSILFLICCTMVVVTMVAGHEYILGQTGRDGNSNTITLQCLDINEDAISNPVFYRNGAPVTDDPCFSEGLTSSETTITIEISPPCEGYFMCGKITSAILSLPTTIYGMSLCLFAC